MKLIKPRKDFRFMLAQRVYYVDYACIPYLVRFSQIMGASVEKEPNESHGYAYVYTIINKFGNSEKIKGMCLYATAREAGEEAFRTLEEDISTLMKHKTRIQAEIDAWERSNRIEGAVWGSLYKITSYRGDDSVK